MQKDPYFDYAEAFLQIAIVLASIDSPLGSLATSFVADIYRPLLVRGRPDAHYLFVSRIAVAGFGVILALLAWGFSFFDKILWLAFKIAGVTFGSLLGVFLLGLTTQRRANRANLVAMTASAVAHALPTCKADENITNLANQPANGGMPASENRKMVSVIARPGPVVPSPA